MPRQGMDPLDLLCDPRLDAAGIQYRAKELFKEYYSLNLIIVAWHCAISIYGALPHTPQGVTDSLTWLLAQ
jgi:hypothetical protein